MSQTCSKCGFAENESAICLRCGWNSTAQSQNELAWASCAEPADKRLFLQVRVLANLDEVALKILFEKLAEVKLFGLEPSVPNRERWLYYASDQEFDDEVLILCGELAARELELSNIVSESAVSFREFIQGDYLFKLVKQGKVSHKTINRFIQRHWRLDEKDGSKFWDRQYVTFLRKGFRTYLEDLVEEFIEIAGTDWPDLGWEEKAEIASYWAGPSGYDGYRARSWKNRWTP